VCRLTEVWVSLRDNYNYRELQERVAPGDEGRPAKRCLQDSGLQGAWRLVVRVSHQAIWKRGAPGDS